MDSAVYSVSTIVVFSVQGAHHCSNPPPTSRSPASWLQSEPGQARVTNYTRVVNTDNKGGHITRENRAIVRVVSEVPQDKNIHLLVGIKITTKGLVS